MRDLFEVRAPVENVNDDTIAILRWLVQNGDCVDKDAPLLVAETTKTSFDVLAPSGGFVWKVAADEGEVPTGAVLCYVGADLEAVRQAAGANGTASPRVEAAVPAAPSEPGEAPPQAVRFSGRARALAESHGLGPADFAGRGLVRERDVMELVAARGAGDAAGARAVPASGVETRVEALPRRKRIEAQYLRSALDSTIPSVATVAVPTTGFFSKTKDRPDLAGLPGAIVIFECARLLRRYPVFNAFHHGGAAYYYADVNIGYAVDLGKGLKVPVIRQADRKPLADIAAEKEQRLVEYINDTLPVEALSGGTFTITDLSGDDVFHFNPVLNQGQSGILGVCSETYPGGGRHGMFSLVLAFDHQLAEGRTAAAFLRDLRDRLRGHEQSLGASAAEGGGEEAACSICLRSVTEIEARQQFLLRTVADRAGEEKSVCSICLQGW